MSHIEQYQKCMKHRSKFLFLYTDSFNNSFNKHIFRNYCLYQPNDTELCYLHFYSLKY